eukprot:gene19611-biopygen25996
MIEIYDGTTVLPETELRGQPARSGDKVYFEIRKGGTGRPMATNVTVVTKGVNKGGRGKGKRGARAGVRYAAAAPVPIAVGGGSARIPPCSRTTAPP